LQRYWRSDNLTPLPEDRLDGIDLLEPLSRSGDTLVLTGVNLQIVNGLGSTATENGTGNLVLGYNEAREFRLEVDRTGSHNVVIGEWHNYGGHSGLVSGWFNTLLGDYGAALGFRNSALGDGATVSGGNDNRAIGNLSSVAGGIRNSAEGLGAAVIGGDSNFARGPQTTITGGASNLATAFLGVIGGGRGLLMDVDGGWAAGGSYPVPARGPGVFRAP
jgi:hypothetical protein